MQEVEFQNILQPPASPTIKPVLRTIGLVRHYGDVRALDGLYLTANEGEIYGFLGRNGAGKTTAIRILMGIIKANGGNLELFGHMCKRPGRNQKQQIGYVSQDQILYPWMSCKRLGRFVSGFYPDWDNTEFYRLLDIFDLPAERRFSHLSSGMKIKLSLALALAHKPALLILDEPTSGLDAVARREFLDIIQRQSQNSTRTTFFSTHRIDEVEYIANRIGIIDRGKMKYEGTVAALRDSIRKVESTSSNFLDEANYHPGFQVLQKRRFADHEYIIFQADGALWEENPFPDATVSSLSLEDIFIAIAEQSIDV